jgi:hypothetical protein
MRHQAGRPPLHHSIKEKEMSANTNVKFDSAVYRRIREMRISEHERQRLLATMRDAELAVDGMLWVAAKIQRLGEWLFLKPSLKH